MRFGLNNHHFRRRGVGLVELLVTLAITAALLTAVAVATDASFRAYAANHTAADLTQKGRMTLHRLLTSIRTTREHAPLSAEARDSFTGGLTVTDSGIAMYDEGGRLLEYMFVPEHGELVVRADGVEHVMLHGVEEFAVTLQPTRSQLSLKTGGSYDLLRRATVVLTITPDPAEVGVSKQAASERLTLSGSAMPRRNGGF